MRKKKVNPTQKSLFIFSESSYVTTLHANKFTVRITFLLLKTDSRITNHTLYYIMTDWENLLTNLV